jgi:hypothetical protein
VDPGLKSPLIDFFRRGEVARDVRLLAARGALAPRAQEQLALLILLSDDPDPEIMRAANGTIESLPRDLLRAFLSRPDTPNEMREFFAIRSVDVDTAGVPHQESLLNPDEPLLDTLSELPEVPEGGDAAEQEKKLLSSLSVLERVKLAMKGTREQRATLIRDPNKLVAVAVLSSPKLTEPEIEQFTRTGNVSEDVLRIIGNNRAWVKNYGVVMGLCKHPKTPPAVSMQIVHRLNDKDLKMLAIDRNIQEGLRLLARKMVAKGKLG